MESRNFLVACSKIKQYYGNKYFGYLTPSEAVELMDAGCIAGEQYENRMRAHKAIGFSNSSWFYFLISREVREVREHLKK